MHIGIIGCGKVGITMGYLVKERHQIIGVYDIERTNMNRACRIFGLKKNAGYRQLLETSTALFFAVPDDAIMKAYGQAVPFMGKATKYLFHFSGLLPAEIFPKKQGLSRASIHPFATFARLIIPPVRKKFFLAIQGDAKALTAACRVFAKDNFSIRRIKRKEKGYYHLLGVFGSNLLVGLLDATFTLAKRLKWRKKDLDDLVFSIIEDTVANARRLGVQNALSGPVKRGDRNTVRRHLKLLKKTPYLSRIYVLLSQNLLKYAPGNEKDPLRKIFSSNSG